MTRLISRFITSLRNDGFLATLAKAERRLRRKGAMSLLGNGLLPCPPREG